MASGLQTKDISVKPVQASSFEDRVCNLVYEKYRCLGIKGKPVAGREWTMLAAVVAFFENGKYLIKLNQWKTVDCEQSQLATAHFSL